jgi:hypothetical protein
MPAIELHAAGGPTPPKNPQPTIDRIDELARRILTGDLLLPKFQRAMRSGGFPRRIVLCVLRAAAQLSTRSLDPCLLAQVYAFRNDGGDGQCPS